MQISNHQNDFVKNKKNIGQIQNNRQIYKGVVGLGMRGVGITEVLAWWKGLAKELELDIENLDEQREDSNRL